MIPTRTQQSILSIILNLVRCVPETKDSKILLWGIHTYNNEFTTYLNLGRVAGHTSVVNYVEKLGLKPLVITTHQAMLSQYNETLDVWVSEDTLRLDPSSIFHIGGEPIEYDIVIIDPYSCIPAAVGIIDKISDLMYNGCITTCPIVCLG